MKTDFLIIGSGIAGLRAAIELSNHGKALIATKDRSFKSSSSYAQGGIAVVIGEDDSAEYHIDDTLRTGAGLCKKTAVKILVENGPPLVQQLIEWGVSFDKGDGEFLIGLEGAHSRRRILHFKDSTGEEIVRVLREKALESHRITKLPKHFVIDLMIRDDRCVGAVLLDEVSGKVYPVIAKATILTTGGAGQLYLHTTNPSGATGDGMAAAYRAGAVLSDMEFIQFHPTTFALPGAPSFLITEAMRGEGAILRNGHNRRFMTDYHPLGELAPRDELSRAIVREIKKGGGEYVLLDATHIRPTILKERFPATYTACLRYGIDITKDMIPVSPAAHFMIGGVGTDTWGRSSIEGLFAAGEVACTGVHGANRLASNSLLEGLVFGVRAGIAAASYTEGVKIHDRIRMQHSDIRVKTWSRTHSAPKSFRTMDVRENLKRIMWNNTGIIRSGIPLNEALEKVDVLTGRISGHGLTRKELELVNMLVAARLIVLSAIRRRESVGTHFREDFPEWSGKKRHIKLQRRDNI